MKMKLSLEISHQKQLKSHVGSNKFCINQNLFILFFYLFLNFFIFLFQYIKWNQKVLKVSVKK